VKNRERYRSSIVQMTSQWLWMLALAGSGIIAAFGLSDRTRADEISLIDVAEPKRTTRVEYAPDVRLTRAQVDLLQIPCDPIVATGLLPATKSERLRTKNGTPIPGSSRCWLVSMLPSNNLQTVNVENTLAQLKAVVEFEGTAEGAVVGSATKVTLKGELVYDRTEKFIRSFSAVQSEKREPGPFSPGFECGSDD
jgi:hypothetical protein